MPHQHITIRPVLADRGRSLLLEMLCWWKLLCWWELLRWWKLLCWGRGRDSLYRVTECGERTFLTSATRGWLLRDDSRIRTGGIYPSSFSF